MFGFGPMNSFFHEGFDESAPDPLYLDEFIYYEEDDCCRATCPNCGHKLKFRNGAERIRCRECGAKLRVN